ncbi:MAG: alpha/beta fold hydrolase [Gemmatimonadetes bacterium]|nr:alpha/beta fold hydrolase [Gemmatimonadota bacterium]
MNRYAGVVIVTATLIGVVVSGPRVGVTDQWLEPVLDDDLDEYLLDEESRVPDLRPGDGRGIVWYDSVARARTPIALVYLHGFSADRHELEPVVSELGSELKANVFFARLSGHGRTGNAMAEATAEDWMDDVAEAVAVGGRIGERVVLIGTSTGGTLAVWAATREEARSRLLGIVLISPNFHPRNRTSRVLLYPWGGQIARAVQGAERCFTPLNERQREHWTTCYPTSALLPMMAFVEHVRTMDLSVITVSSLVLYSADDTVVDTRETDRVLATFSGSDSRAYVVTTTTDPDGHVLAGDIMSPQSNEEVQSVIADFVRGLAASGELR